MKRRTFIGGLAAAPVLPAPALARDDTLEREKEFVFLESVRLENGCRDRMFRNGEASMYRRLVTMVGDDGTTWPPTMSGREPRLVHGLSFGWPRKDVARAMDAGHGLYDFPIVRQIQNAESQKLAVFLVGSAKSNLHGIVNNPNIPTESFAWHYKFAGNRWIVDLFNEILGGDGVLRDTLVMAPYLYMRMHHPIADGGDDDEMSVMESIRRDNPYTKSTGKRLTVAVFKALEKVGGHYGRVVAYPNDPDVLACHVLKDIEFNGPQLTENRSQWTFSGSMVLGGLEIRHPEAVKYLDLV